MAYITKEQVQEMRKEIKKVAPDWKISLTRFAHMEVRMVVRSAPIDLLSEKWKDYSFNTFNWKELDGLPGIETLRKISAILYKGNHDNSDIMTDYFDVGWYVDMRIGDWQRPFVVK